MKRTKLKSSASNKSTAEILGRGWVLLQLGALVLTYNEENVIEECMESLSWVDEIVVVDSYSDDDTLEICNDYTRKIYQREFDDFSSQRNYGLEKIESDWILILDADERIPGVLAEEVKNLLNNDGDFPVYKIPRKNFFLGSWIKHCGWYPDYTIRLFKNSDELRYEGEVHEDLTYEGECGRLENPLIHLTYSNLDDYVSKINHYTSLEIEKSSRNINLIQVILRPKIEFIKKYFLQKGFLDGSAGLILCMLSAINKFLKYAKLWEAKKKFYFNDNHE